MPLTTFIDPHTGKARPIDDFVEWFQRVWADPSGCSYEFLRFTSPDIELSAPLAGRTKGRAAGDAAFRRTFSVFPDLSATIGIPACSDDELILPMRFRATAGGRPVEWDSIDRFTFRDGSAVARRAYFNPLPVMFAIARSPTTLLRYLKIRFRR